MRLRFWLGGGAVLGFAPQHLVGADPNCGIYSAEGFENARHCKKKKNKEKKKLRKKKTRPELLIAHWSRT